MANFPKGSLVWVKDEDECFIAAKVNSGFKAGAAGSVSLVGGKKEMRLSPAETKDAMSMDEQSLKPLSNMVDLKQLNEASILYNLRLRFGKNDIYTNIGSILVSINPFKLLPIYTPKVLEKYMKQGSRDLPPHVFGVADDAYKQMTGFGKSQSCIVSGESGAGKTEATKLFLQYIAEISSGGEEQVKSAKQEKKATLQEQILEANPLMEAFGNAKTVRNDNSSRFGKWIDIKFDQKRGTIVGASITSYLLEKSRIVQQAEGERNYHIFYQLCSSASMDPAFEKLKIQDAAQYYYLNQSKQAATTVKGIDDNREYEATMAAMTSLGISKKESQAIIGLLAGILHLGNVTFEGSDKSKVGNKDMLKLAAEQLGAKAGDLEEALVKRSVAAGREVVKADQNVEAAKSARDSFAKGMYSYLFDWLIMKINASLSSAGSGKKSGSTSSIGVLDIFGFERFEHNSFEQLCINYCNEKLQGHFNEHIFKQEQIVYKKEGIDVSQIPYTDNSDILEMLEKRGTGVFGLIDEEIFVPRGSEEGLLSKIIKNVDGKILAKPDPKSMRSNPALKNCFTVIHYAGGVDYNVLGFLEKNKDALMKDLENLGASSKIPFIKDLFNRNASSGGGGGGKKNTLAIQFKAQLSTLMETLNATEPHYVRCIKPNSEKVGDVFTSKMVLSQLRYAGLLEVCKIRQIGYPVRKLNKEFLNRYRPLALDAAKSLKTLSAKLEKNKLLKKGEYQLGKTQVFLRTAQFNDLEEHREKALFGVVVKIQKVARGFVMRTRYKKYKKINEQLKTAVKKKDPKLLEAAILAAGQLPYAGKGNKGVDQARKLFNRVKEERELLEMLKKAVDSKDEGSISGALKACKEKKLGKKKEVKAAEKMLKTIKEQSVLKTKLRKALKKPNLDTLKELISAAEAAKMDGTVELRDAKALKLRLGNEKSTKAALKKAIKGKKTKEIEKLVTKMMEMGCGNDPLVKEAEKVAKIQVGMSVQTSNQVAQTEKELAEAIKKKDLVRLNELEVRVIELGLTGELVDSALEMRSQLEQQVGEASELATEVKALTIKAGSLDGVTKKDLDPFSKLIKSTVSKGVEKSNPVVVEALALEERVKKIIKASSTIKAAVESKDKKKQKDALELINSLGIQTEDAKKIQAEMRTEGAGRLAEDRRASIIEMENNDDHEALKHPTKTDLQKVAMQRLAKSGSKGHKDRIEKASKEFYHFTKFFQIRTDEDYTQFDLPLLKKMRAESKLSYQARRITNSILELDRDLAKIALRNHKALLGYTGDVASNSFSTTLAQDIIIRGLEIPELIDEIYIQICKHLTKNGKKDSLDRGWLLMCMCTKHFPPTKDFELYLMNFLIEHRGVPGLIGNYARLSLFQLDATIQMGASNLIPPLYDIKMYTKRPPILAEVHNVDGSSNSYAVTPDITVAMLVGMCTTRAKMNNKIAKQFGIFVKDNDFTYTQYGDAQQTTANAPAESKKAKKSRGLNLPVSAAVEAAMDMFDGASKFLGLTQRKPLPSPQSSWPLMGATFPGDVYLRMAKQGREPVFSFKRKLMLSPSEDKTIDKELYLQLLDEVLFGNLLIKSDEDRVKIVAIAMAAKSANFPSSEKALLDAGLMKLVPITWRMRKSVDDWAKAVHKQGASFAKLGQARLHENFVRICQNSPVYGMNFFSVFRQDNNRDYICGVNHKGVHLLSEKLELLYTFDYKTIQKFGASARYVWIKIVSSAMKKDKEMSKLFQKSNNSILQLHTLQSTEMYGLIYDYTHYSVN